MLTHPLIISTSKMNLETTPDGEWTPVSEGVSWERAIYAASALLATGHLATRGTNDLAYITAQRVLASMLIYARGQKGGSLHSAELDFLTKPLSEYGNGWPDIYEELERIGRFDRDEADDAGLRVAQVTAHRVAAGWLLSAKDVLADPGVASTVLGDVLEAMDVRKGPSHHYKQPWDAPDTLELQLVRRDSHTK